MVSEWETDKCGGGVGYGKTNDGGDGDVQGRRNGENRTEVF